jgi:hypothetical protein
MFTLSNWVLDWEAHMKVAAAASMEVLNAVEWFSGMAGYRITLGNFSFRLVGVE